MHQSVFTPIQIQLLSTQDNNRHDINSQSSKKKPKGSRHIELMEWLPTLPQLFAYLGFTQFLLMFWIFIGECANDVAATWNLVMMWWVK